MLAHNTDCDLYNNDTYIDDGSSTELPSANLLYYRNISMAAAEKRDRLIVYPKSDSNMNLLFVHLADDGINAIQQCKISKRTNQNKERKKTNNAKTGFVGILFDMYCMRATNLIQLSTLNDDKIYQNAVTSMPYLISLTNKTIHIKEKRKSVGCFLFL